MHAPRAARRRRGRGRVRHRRQLRWQARRVPLPAVGAARSTMSITLTLRHVPPARVDASPLTPERLTALNAGRVAGLLLRCGRDTVEVGELFEVGGYVGDGTLTLA